MAFIEGDDSFEGSVIQLELEIESRFNKLAELNQAFRYLIPEPQWQSLINEYEALMSHWRDDSAISNFEFHNYFIDIIIKLLPQLSDPVVDYTLGNTSSIAINKQKLLSEMTFQSIPSFIEILAKIRGLVTHASVTGSSDQQIRSRINYLLQSMAHYKEQIRITLTGIQNDKNYVTPRLFDPIIHEHKISQLNELISSEIMNKDSITTESHLIFDFVTNIINVYLSMIDLGISLLQSSVDSVFAHNHSASNL